MTVLRGLFELLEEQQKYQAYFPVVVLAYIYFLSSESDFIFLAIFFTANATLLVEIREYKEKMYNRAMNHDNLTKEQAKRYQNRVLDALHDFLSSGNYIGYLVAAAVSWNNVVEQGLMIPPLPEFRKTAFINVLLSDYVSTPNIPLIALLFLALVIIMKPILNLLVRIVYKKVRF